MVVETKYWGSFEVKEDKVVMFVEDLAGFAGFREFALIPIPQHSPFICLQAINNPEVGFVIVDPWQFISDYSPVISDNDAQSLDLNSPSDALLFTLVTADSGADNKLSLNLLAPLVININSGKAKQVVLENSNYSTNSSICFPEGSSKQLASA